MRLSNRGAGVVLHTNALLVMHRIKNGKEYWVFPGGGIEEGETPEQTVKRELHEETTLDVVVDRLLYVHRYIGPNNSHTTHYFYLCIYTGGEPKLGPSEEKDEMVKGENYYKPLWIDIKVINNLLLYPLEIRDWLMHDLKSGFAKQPREAVLRVDALRQSL